jgi:hypothetical protein
MSTAMRLSALVIGFSRQAFAKRNVKNLSLKRHGGLGLRERNPMHRDLQLLEHTVCEHPQDAYEHLG